MDEQINFSRLGEDSRTIIVVDGPNFSGKTTFVNRLLGTELARSRASRVLNFPRGDSPWGKLARRAFADPTATEAVRGELVAKDFADELEDVAETYANEVVIWDRFYLSTCCCQGSAGYHALVEERLFDRPVQPDYYVVLDVDYPTALERAKKKRAKEGVAWDQRIEDLELQSQESWDAARERFMYYARLLKEHLPETLFMKVDQHGQLTYI